MRIALVVPVTTGGEPGRLPQRRRERGSDHRLGTRRCQARLCLFRQRRAISRHGTGGLSGQRVRFAQRSPRPTRALAAYLGWSVAESDRRLDVAPTKSSPRRHRAADAVRDTGRDNPCFARHGRRARRVCRPQRRRDRRRPGRPTRCRSTWRAQIVASPQPPARADPRRRPHGGAGARAPDDATALFAELAQAGSKSLRSIARAQ